MVSAMKTLYRRMALVGVFVAVSALSGCIGHTTTTSATQGKAYVVVGHVFGTAVYYCDAAEGQPTCWEVSEQEKRGGQ
jgi:hypothetical protein